MTVFYRGPCVHITHEVFQVRGPYQRKFAIRELSQVYVVQRTVQSGQTDRTADRAVVHVQSAGLAGVAAVLAAVAAIGGPVLDEPSMSLTALGVLALIGVVLALSWAASGTCLWIRPTRVLQLWAVYHGQHVCLFESTNAQTFGQVKRALVRAVEQLGENR